MAGNEVRGNAGGLRRTGSGRRATALASAHPLTETEPLQAFKTTCEFPLRHEFLMKSREAVARVAMLF